MNWEMLTAIGQLATVCVGVPSIIYFAIQLREQNRERRQSAVNALAVQWGDLTKALHENAEFTALYLRGIQSFHDLDAQWAKAAAAKDVEQTIAYYSDDAIVLPPNATSAATKEAIRNGWKDMFASPGFVITWQPTRVQVGKSSEMAWVSGTYELTMDDATGKRINDRGKYLEIWEKQSDGNWKCGADMWNSDLPASAFVPIEKK